jgi:deazaflavin-dependent oxidoreductase (nitroreductase family)
VTNIAEQSHPTSLHRLVKYLVAQKYPSQFLARYLHRVDKFVLGISRGKTSATGLLTGLPVVYLTTIGAKSGKERKLPLVGFFDGEKVILIASNFGNVHHPAWYHNLRANPYARLSSDNEEREYLAREAHDNERAVYWQKVNSCYQGYARYQQWAGGRLVPVLILEPVP